MAELRPPADSCNTVAAPALTTLILLTSWRWMFAAMGLAGLLVVVVWFGLYRDLTDLALTTDERLYLAEGDAAAVAPMTITWRDWRRLLSFSTTWGLVVGAFGSTYTGWIFLAWLPGYLEMERHLTLERTGVVAAIPYLWGAIGALSTGWLTDHLIRRGYSPIGTRKYLAVFSLIGLALTTAATAEATSIGMTVVVVSTALFLSFTASSALYGLSATAVPASSAGSLASIQNFGGYFGAALAPTITGFVVQYTGSFNPALLFDAGVGAAGALAASLFIGSSAIPPADQRIR